MVKEALDQCCKSSFDLIFMDVEMPVLNGIDATIQIRKNEQAAKVSRPVPIIGYLEMLVKPKCKRGLDAGMDAYLKKPYEKSQVYQSIKTFVSHR